MSAAHTIAKGDHVTLSNGQNATVLCAPYTAPSGTTYVQLASGRTYGGATIHEVVPVSRIERAVA